MLHIHQAIHAKLGVFLSSGKIPHIIFHGMAGTGKQTIVNDFISNIYGGDLLKVKTSVKYVNCAHGNGIKSIRNDLKNFAKTHIYTNDGAAFKTIVLFNADNLTTDAQSALRRCIEVFSHNTRFFIIVENKHRLLNPILSRFCEIHIPEYFVNGEFVNLHKRKLASVPTPAVDMAAVLHLPVVPTVAELQQIAVQIYEKGGSCMDIIAEIGALDTLDEKVKVTIQLYFHKIKLEFRCEKLLIFYVLYMYYFRLNYDLKKVSFI